ncbi:hypothetical protein [Thalassolituus marinus]|uniref:Uncharacterized protein n=1 Tax=Thalassolituus marinus TaxID=671053 RepID=A0ABS7ZUX4_9GAMM|nr:hypothetical protein [Thalassolituus marinus]MCA6065380.1 hypothetical protein [Thalassolituus marinus]
MYIVHKSEPNKIVRTLSAKDNSLLLQRVIGGASSSVDPGLKDLLVSLHEEGVWVICSCRPDLPIESQPALAVVKRAGTYFLRNLPSREGHKDCRFSYVRSAPWLAEGETVEGDAAESVAGSDSEILGIASIHRKLLKRAGWSGYDQEWTFLSAIEAVDTESAHVTVGGAVLKGRLSQSGKELFRSPGEAFGLCVVHEVDWSGHQLTRVERQLSLTRRFEGGIVPAQPGISVSEGPFLAFIAPLSEGYFAASVLPVLSSRVPVPVLSDGERSIARLLVDYSDWLFKQGIDISFRKVSDGSGFAPGFLITSGDVEVALRFGNERDVQISEGVITVPSDSDWGALDGPGRALKRVIRENLLMGEKEKGDH